MIKTPKTTKIESPKSKNIKEIREGELTKEAIEVRKGDATLKPKRKEVRGFKKREDEFEQKIIDLARVTRVMAGGKRMNFRASVIVGDRKGKIGFGVAKGADVSLAVNKATLKAKKAVIIVKIVNETIPYQVNSKFKASKVMMKPASKGTGIIAGGAMRSVLEIAGVPNVVAKSLGSSNKINNIICTINAFEKLNLVSKK